MSEDEKKIHERVTQSHTAQAIKGEVRNGAVSRVATRAVKGSGTSSTAPFVPEAPASGVSTPNAPALGDTGASSAQSGATKSAGSKDLGASGTASASDDSASKAPPKSDATPNSAGAGSTATGDSSSNDASQSSQNASAGDAKSVDSKASGSQGDNSSQSGDSTAGGDSASGDSGQKEKASQKTSGRGRYGEHSGEESSDKTGSALNKLADATDAVADTAMSGGSSGDGTQALATKIGGEKAGKAVGAVGASTVDNVVGGAIDDAVDWSVDRAGPTPFKKPEPTTKYGKEAREDKKTVLRHAGRGAYQGAKAGGLYGAAAGAIKGVITGALRTNAARRTTKFLAGAGLAFLAFLVACIMMMTTIIAQTISTAVAGADQSRRAEEGFLGEGASHGDLDKAQDAVNDLGVDLEWTVMAALNQATGYTPPPQGGGSAPPTPSMPAPSESASPSESVAPSESPAPNAKAPKDASVSNRVFGPTAIPGATTLAQSSPLSVPGFQVVSVSTTATPSPGPSETPADGSPTASPTETASAPAPSVDAGTPGEYPVDKEKAKKDFGLTDEDFEDMPKFSRWLATTIAVKRDEVARKKGMTVTLNSGSEIDPNAIFFTTDSGKSQAEVAREAYVEAIKSLPLEGIDEKADGIYDQALRWWYGQSCTVPGSQGGVANMGNFTGKGVPPEAVPWVKNAASHSEYQIPAAFFAYIMDRETDFRPGLFANDRNGGTWGLFQINAHEWRTITKGGSFDSPNIKDPMVHTEYGAKYFDNRLETVRKMRAKNPTKPYATELTDLEALMIAHNAGEGNLKKYPNLPSITRGYLEEFRQKFQGYGGGEPSQTRTQGGQAPSPTGNVSNQGNGSQGDAGTPPNDSGSSAQEASNSSASTGDSPSGKLVKPYGKHPMTSPYGPRKHPVTGGYKFHAGADYGIPSGTDLYAMFDGVVTFSGWMSGYGNYLIVKGNFGGKELGYAFAHNTKNLVKVGDKVTAGQVIALSGNTGVGTGPHLHLELRTADFSGPGREHNTADPVKFLESNGATVDTSGTVQQSATQGQNASCQGAQNVSNSVPPTPGGPPSFDECKQIASIEDGQTPDAIAMGRAICNAFPQFKSYGGRRYSSAIGCRSDHYTGNAIDIMTNTKGVSSADGTQLAQWLAQHHEQLKVKYIIWEQKVWRPKNPVWKKMGDRGNDTLNHYDHVHVSVLNNASGCS